VIEITFPEGYGGPDLIGPVTIKLPSPFYDSDRKDIADAALLLGATKIEIKEGR